MQVLSLKIKLCYHHRKSQPISGFTGPSKLVHEAVKLPPPNQKHGVTDSSMAYGNQFYYLVM